MESKSISLFAPGPIKKVNSPKEFHWPNFLSPNWYPPGKGGNRNKVKAKRRKAVLKAHRK